MMDYSEKEKTADFGLLTSFLRVLD